MRVQPIRTLLNKIPYGALPWESFGLPITWAAESLTAASTSALVLVGSTFFSRLPGPISPRHLLLVASKQRPVLHGGTARLLALAEQGQSAHRRRLVNLSKLELNRQCALWIRNHIFAAR